MSLGLVEYRAGLFDEAARTLAVAEQSAGKYQDIPVTARCYRAMCLSQQGQREQARKLLDQVELAMPALPTDLWRPLLNDKVASHDTMISWLAYQEARSLCRGK